MGKERPPRRTLPEPNIGTWPTPERWKQMLELIVDLEKAVKPIKGIKEISGIIIDFRKKICRQLEGSIRSDIGCLCKYNREDISLCHPKIKECLGRLIETYPLYQQLCC